MALRHQGLKLREIGERYGISIARVSQIIKRVKHENGGDKNAQTDTTGDRWECQLCGYELQTKPLDVKAPPNGTVA